MRIMDSDQVTVAVLRGECFDCSREFISHELPDLVYGYKLLRFPDGSVAAVLSCLANPVFHELLKIVDKVAGPQADENAAVEACCDPIDGQRVAAGLRPRCPACGSFNVDEFDHRPSQMTVLSLPRVTHHEWVNMSREDREQAVRRTMRIDDSR